MTTAAKPELIQERDAAEVTRHASFSVRIDTEALAALEEATRADPKADTRIPLVFSSEFGVERFDWWEGERYLEVLDHSPGAVDLSRAERGLPFLDTHNIYSLSAQLGRVEEVKLRADGKLGGMLRLSQRAEAQAYRQDLIDGIAGEVSVGYRIDPTRVDRITKEGELTRYIVRRWTPHEVSGVPVPADPTVGVGRALEGAHPSRLPVPFPRADAVVSARAVPPTTDLQTDAPTGQENTVIDTNTAPDTGGTGVTVTRSEAPDLEARRKTLAELAEKHGVQEAFARGMATGGGDLDKVSDAMLGEISERMKRGAQFSQMVSMSEREEKAYSFSRAILHAHGGENCLEREVSDSIAKRLPIGYQPKNSGIFVPTSVRAPLVAGTSATGGAFVFTQQGSFIDLLRNKTFVLQAGATQLVGLSAPVSFPKHTSSGTAYWVAENDTAVTESNLGTGLISLTPKTLMATQAFSKQWLLEARNVVDGEMLVRSDLARLHAIAIDAAAIAGLGSSNQPLGITKSTAVGTVAMGTHGAVPTYDALVDQEVQIRSGNVDGGLSYITTPGIAGKLKKTQKFSSTNGEAVWTGDLINGQLNGAKAFATNNVPSSLTKGTSTTVCHAIIAGAFENLYWGEFGALEIITDPYAQKKKGLIEVTSFQMVDLAIRYDAAFSIILDAKTS